LVEKTEYLQSNNTTRSSRSGRVTSFLLAMVAAVTKGTGAATAAGLPAFLFLDPVRRAEDGEEGSPPAVLLCFLVGFEGIMIIIMK